MGRWTGLIVPALILIAACARTVTAPERYTHYTDVPCGKVTFYVSQDGEVVHSYLTTPDVEMVTAQGVRVRPGECVIVLAVAE
jgi:hypothetical protein